MTVTISCLDLGHTCPHEVSGESFADILRNIQRHAMEEHGASKALVNSPERIDLWKAAIRQSARPRAIRTLVYIDPDKL